MCKSPKDFNINKREHNSSKLSSLKRLDQFAHKSPKDFNVIYLECNSGSKHKFVNNPERVEPAKPQ